MYTDFEDSTSSPVLSMATSSSSGWTAVAMENDKRDHDLATKLIHPLTLRPWDITVLVNVYKVHAKLPVVSRVTYSFLIMSLTLSLPKDVRLILEQESPDSNSGSVSTTSLDFPSVHKLIVASVTKNL